MLVLKTTSPPVCPGAPAASPSYHTPFSSASVAFIDFLFILERACDALHLAGQDAGGRGPWLLAGHFNPHPVRADRNLGNGDRPRADVLAVHHPRRPLRPAVHVQGTGEAAV